MAPCIVIGALLLLLCSRVSFAFWTTTTKSASKLLPVVENDDYCDSGNDETKSAACAGHAKQQGLFHCADEQYFPNQTIPFSRVSDGVCDCCDGSDESPNTVSCESSCERLGREKQEEEQRVLQQQQKGIELKTVKVFAARQQLLEIRANSEKSSHLIPEYEKLIKEKKKELKAEKELEAQEAVQVREFTQASVSSALTTAENMPALTRDTLITLISTIALRGKEDSAEAVLAAMVKMPKEKKDGPAPDDSEVIVLAMETPQVTDEDLSTTTVDKLKPELVDQMAVALSLQKLSEGSLFDLLLVAIAQSQRKKTLMLSVIDAGMGDAAAAAMAALPFLPVDNEKYTRPQTEALRDAIKESEEKLKKLRDGSKDSMKVLRTEFGPDDSLFYLFGKCFQLVEGAYKYEVCPFADAKQGHTLLGKHERVIQKEDGSSLSLFYSRGERCMGTSDKRARTMRLDLKCAATEGDGELVNMVEEEVCTYSASLLTSIAC